MFSNGNCKHKRGFEKSNLFKNFSFRIICLMLLLCSFASAATYYLDPSQGSDSNPGTSTAPWKTVTYAESNAQPGSTVYMRSGNYGSVSITRSSSGRSSWSEAVTFVKASGATCNFSVLSLSGDVSRYVIFDGLTFSTPNGSNCVNITDSDYIKVRNSLLRGSTNVSGAGSVDNMAQSGINIAGSNASNIYIEKNEITQTRRGILILNNHGENVYIQGNWFHVFNASVLRLAYSGSVSRLYIWDNNIQGPCIDQYNDHSSMISLRRDNVDIRRNVIHGGGFTGLIRTYHAVPYYQSNGYNNITIENNMFYDQANDSYALLFNDLGRNFKFNNNTICNNHEKTASDCSDRTGSNNYGSGFVFEDAGKDGTLAASSDASTFQICNNVFVTKFSGAPSGIGAITGNIFWAVYYGGALRDQSWLNSNWPGNKVYTSGTSEPQDFEKSGVFFVGGGASSLWDTWAYTSPGSCWGPANKDLHTPGCWQLAPGSAAIGFGNPKYAPSTDILGNPRGSVIDSGCYAYTMGVANAAPKLNSIGNKTIAENTKLEFTISATDADGDALTYSASGLPAGATFSSSTRVFSWTPKVEQAGDHSVTFKVTDGKATASETIKISVIFKDVDVDGLPDWWEMKYFGNLNQTPSGDPDKDGLTNLEEFQRGTDPTVFDDMPDSLVLSIKADNDPVDGAIDSSKYLNHGISDNGSAPNLVTGQKNMAYDFNGTSHQINCGNDASLNLSANVTISAWICPRTFGSSGFGRIIDKGSTGGYSLYLKQAGNQLSYLVYGKTIVDSKTNVIALNKWQHVAVVHNGSAGTVTFYVDGSQVSQAAGVGAPEPSQDNLYIGTRGDLTRYFDGIIDELRVYNRAMTSTEVMKLFNEQPELTFEPIGNKQVDEGKNLTFAVITMDPNTEVYISEHTLPTEPLFTSGMLVGNWAMNDEAATTVVKDNSYNKNDGVANRNTDQLHMPGKINGALNFNATTDKVTIPANTIPAGDFTLAGWIYWTALVSTESDDLGAAFGSAVKATAIKGVAVRRNITVDTLELVWGNGSISKTMTITDKFTSANTGKWVFVAASYKAADAVMTVYLNGNKVNQQSAAYSSSGVAFEIGHSALDSTKSFWNGGIDSVMVFDQTLTANEIAALYNGGSGTEFFDNVFTWSPGQKDAGVYKATFVAPNGLIEDVETISITVNKTNVAPILAPLADVTASENKLISFNVIATDEDGDNVVITASNMPTGASFNGKTFAWTPSSSQLGTHKVTFTASDGSLTATGTITITVTKGTADEGNGDTIEGLVGHWRFDEATGTTARDSSPSGNDGVLKNGPLWKAGKFGHALDFDGTDDFVQIEGVRLLDNSSSFTMAAWIKPDSFGGSGFGRIIDKGTSTTGYSLYVRNSSKGLSYVPYGGKVVNSNNGVVQLGLWQHVAIVYNAETQTAVFYVNGEQSGSSSGITAPVSSEGSPMIIASRGYDNSRNFDGMIDDVRVFNKSLTALEISTLMNVVTTNNPPVIAAIGNKTVTEEQQLTFAVTASDVDGDAVVLSAQGLPAGAAFSNGSFTWKPAKGQAGTYTVTFTASDGIAQDTETVTITVKTSVVAPSGLVASWIFDEGSGMTVLDTTGNGNNGTLDGAKWTTGVSGSAVDLDGTNAKVVIADKSGLSPKGSFTVSAWINPRSFGGSGYGRIFDKGDASTGFSFYLYESNQALSYAIYGGKTARSKNGVIAINKWQHVVMAYDNATGFVTFYVDGVNAGFGNVGSLPADCTGKNGYIGMRGYDLSRAFNGVVDNVKVFNRALTAEEIAQL